MLVPLKDQKKEFNKHIDMLCANCPGGKNKAELFKEFMEEFNTTSVLDANFFYEFTLAFESFLYFNYHMEPDKFKYFNLERFYF